MIQPNWSSTTWAARRPDEIAPWTVVKSNDKKRARINAMRYVLGKFDYDNKDYEVVGWYALVGPRKLPDVVQARLKRALSEVSKDPAFRRAMTDGGYTINTGDAAALQQRIDREYALWADVIQSANIQAN